MLVRLWMGIFVWFNLALCAGAFGLVGAFPPPFPQLLLMGITGGLLLVWWNSSAFRSMTNCLSLEALVRFHAVRFVGVYFLVLQSRGELPMAFATVAGWGDIAVASSALAVSCLPSRSRSGRGVLLLWNIFGLVDILFVVGLAGRVAMASPQSMSALTRLPLSLLPTFVVPIAILTHALIFVRLGRLNRT